MTQAERKTKSCLLMFKSEAFCFGVNSALRGGPFLPEDYFEAKWDQINYERGWLFGRVLKREGQRVQLRPTKKPPESISTQFRLLVRERAIT